ncbi:sensor histidine kinase [Corynebacterium cystitidis]|uniref:sensor histidine kinase n=1 Tax=Corynebacterium cystitidis TaxID=35757 RepID=UPI00115F8612|nr:histidine kinase [Corynebacterium cystitidis]
MPSFSSRCVLDLVAATIAASTCLIGASTVARPFPYVLAALIFVAVLARRRWPLATVVALLAALTAAAFEPMLTPGVIVAACVASYIIFRDLTGTARLLTAIALYAGVFLAVTLVVGDISREPWQQRLLYVAWGLTFLTVFAMLGLLRQREEHSRTREVELSLARQREQFELQQAQQRTLIAHEIHDIVTHSLTAVVAQADGALYHPEPAAQQQALRTISTVARNSLREMRGVVEVLREGDSASAQPRASHTDIPSLLFDADALTTIGNPPNDLRDSTSLTLYRIAQEAITNARTHGTGPIEVTVRWSPTEVCLEVSNRVTGSSEPGTGLGIAGMRRRAQLLGGSLDVVDKHNRWYVTARLPLKEEP